MRKHIKTILTIVLSAFLFLGTVNITSHVYAEAGEQSSESLGDAEETSETTSQDDAQETLEESPESSSDTGSGNVDETLEDGSGDGIDSEESSAKTTTTDAMTGTSTALTTTTVEEPEDLHDLPVEELFEYLLSIDSDKFDELYDKYDDLDSILERLSDTQAETIQEKFGNDNIQAIATDTTWQSDWTYAINGTYIWLHTYNGSETTYTIPASATIDGTTYKTEIGYWNSQSGLYSKLNAELDTGTIQNLSFEKGIAHTTSLTALFINNTTIQTIDFTNLSGYIAGKMEAMFYGCTNLKSVKALTSISTSKLTTTRRMFANCDKLSEIDLNGFNTSLVTTMSGMFNYCNSLTSLDVSNFDTSKVTDMSYMFSGCSNLRSLDVSNFVTTNVTNMSCMFYDCINLRSLDVSNFDTSNVTNMSSMFYGCSNLTSLDVSSFDTSKVTDTKNMFNNCNKLAIIYATSLFSTDKATSSSSMFSNCTSLANFDSSYVDKEKAISTDEGGYLTMVYRVSFNANSGTFEGKKINSILYPVSGGGEIGTYKIPSQDNSDTPFLGWSTSSASVAIEYGTDGTDIPTNQNLTLYAVYESLWCVNWDYEIKNSYIHLKKYNGTETDYTIPASVSINGTTYTTRIGTWGLNPYNESIEASETLAELDTGTIQNLSFENGVAHSSSLFGLFANNHTIQSIDFTNLSKSTSINLGSTFINCSNLISIKGIENIFSDDIKTFKGTFYGCGKLQKIDLSSLNTAKATDMEAMFFGCSTISSLDLSTFDTSNVTNMKNMFYECSNLISLDLSNFVTTNVTNMAGMFHKCEKLSELVVSSFDTGKVTDMSFMFNYCQNLMELNVNNFVTATVTNMSGMFQNCEKLNELDVSSFNTDNVINMAWMFNYCKNLTNLDVSNFATTNVTSMRTMFQHCEKISELDLSNFDTSNVTEMAYMFCGSGLKILDLTNFNTSAVTNMTEMFYKCNNLERIYVTSKFSTTNVTDSTNMFYNCSNLLNFDSSVIDKAKAIPTYEGGYLTIPEVTITNTVSGNMGNKTKDFSYTASLPTNLYSKTVSIRNSDNRISEASVDENGEVDFTLENGESLIFTDVTVKEMNAILAFQESYSTDGYLTTTEVGSDNGTVQYKFMNARETAVPTGNHNNDAYLWLTLIGIIGIVGFVLSRTILKQS